MCKVLDPFRAPVGKGLDSPGHCGHPLYTEWDFSVLGLSTWHRSDCEDGVTFKPQWTGQWLATSSRSNCPTGQKLPQGLGGHLSHPLAGLDQGFTQCGLWLTPLCKSKNEEG